MGCVALAWYVYTSIARKCQQPFSTVPLLFYCSITWTRRCQRLCQIFAVGPSRVHWNKKLGQELGSTWGCRMGFIELGLDAIQNLALGSVLHFCLVVDLSIRFGSFREANRLKRLPLLTPTKTLFWALRFMSVLSLICPFALFPFAKRTDSNVLHYSLCCFHIHLMYISV